MPFFTFFSVNSVFVVSIHVVLLSCCSFLHLCIVTFLCTPFCLFSLTPPQPASPEVDLSQYGVFKSTISSLHGSLRWRHKSHAQMMSITETALKKVYLKVNKGSSLRRNEWKDREKSGRKGTIEHDYSEITCFVYVQCIFLTEPNVEDGSEALRQEIRFTR